MCCLIDRYENVFKNNGERCAVVYWENGISRTLSYDKVQKISLNITKLIRTVILEKHTCIGLFMDHNPYIPSLIISLQRNCIPFMFIDPKGPKQNLQLQWIITYNQERFEGFSHHLKIEESLNLLKNTSIDNINNRELETVCFIVSTSGTTGEPKLIKVTHQCIWSNINSLRRIFDVTENDVIYFGTPLTFDPAMVELFLALTNGSTLLMVPNKIKTSHSSLLKYIFQPSKSVTILQMVPSLFLRWNQDDIKYILQNTSLRILGFGGEKFPESILEMKRSEHLRIFNLYGITEVSCWATVFEVTGGCKSVSLGTVLDDTLLEVRVQDAKITNGLGELYVGSHSRICYINQEKDEDIIKPLFRPTGDIVRINDEGLFYIGRNNCIIKRLGHKINLIKIEEDIYRHTNIYNACIWLEDLKKIVVFMLIKESNADVKQRILDKLRIRLLHVLPRHSFPDHLEIISDFPLNKHGKINKIMLEEIYRNLRDFDKNPIDVFKYLWCKYLGLISEDFEDYYECNFFESGGTSILAVQYLSEFQDVIGAECPNSLANLLFESTLRECCRFIGNTIFTHVRKRPHSEDRNRNNQIKVSNTGGFTIEIAWMYNMEACIDTFPQILKIRESTMIAIGSFSHIFAILDSKSGNLIAKTILPDAIESGCCVSANNNHVYVGCYDGKMYCLEVLTGNIVWEYETNDRIKCTPCHCMENEAIVFGSYDKYLHCVGIKLGNLIWKTILNESITSSPLVYKNQIYIATTFGTCLCISESDGCIYWKRLIGSPIFSSPCLYYGPLDNVIWADVKGVLHALCCNTGEEKWTFKVEGNIFSSVIKHNDNIIFGCEDHHIYCVQILEDFPKLRYKIMLDSGINATPCIMDERYIIAASNKGNIYVIDYNSGLIIECLQLQGQIFSSPAVDQLNVYIGCRDNNLYCLKIAK